MIQFSQFLLERATVADSIGNLVTHYHSMYSRPDRSALKIRHDRSNPYSDITYDHPVIPKVYTVLEPRMFGNLAGSISYDSERPLGKHRLPHMFAHGLAVFAHHMQTNPDVNKIQFTGSTPTHYRLYDRLHQHFQQGDFNDHPVLKHFDMHAEDVLDDVDIDNPNEPRNVLYHKYTLSRKNDQ